jgi:hypothetical protein
MRFEGSGLMHLDGNPHGCKEPTGVPTITHPTPSQCEDVFDYGLHRFHGLSSWLAPSAVCRPIQDCDYLPAFRGTVTLDTRGGRQDHPPLSLPRGKQSLIFRFPVELRA